MNAAYRKILRAVVAAGLGVGVALAAFSFLTPWYPAFDIVNNGLPVLVAGVLTLFVLAAALRAHIFTGLTAILLAAVLALFVPKLGHSAPPAPKDADRFLRVASFNLLGPNDQNLQAIGRFLAKTEADILVLEEVRPHHTRMIESLSGQYPTRIGKYGIVLLSKYPSLDYGRVDRPDRPYWSSLLIRWARLDVNGTVVTLAGTHLARPFHPELQAADIAALTRFVQSRSGPVIVAGDFNMTPWTAKLAAFTQATGLRSFNTFTPTWPMRRKALPLLPVLPIDHIFASEHFAKIAVAPGPRLASDHRPIIADISAVHAPAATARQREVRVGAKFEP